MWTIESFVESLIAVTICALLFVLLVLSNRETGVSKKKSSVSLKKPPIK